MTGYELAFRLIWGPPPPPVPDMPGVVHACRDEPLDPDSLHDVTEPAELARLLGVTRQRAHQILSERAATAQPTERTEP